MQRPDYSAGTSAGFKSWLFFMIVLSILGYQPYFSIALGAISGLTWGFIVSWWNAKEDFAADEPVHPKPVQVVEKPSEMVIPPLENRELFRRYGKHRRQHIRPAVRRFGALFRRDRP